ncbi:MAG: VCBS repeat-containing protein [Candidatus Kerfeldbacteria bacterium]|nr:VCBS repeat-containing protein [Candidatus Kerfeldbacteria bacterium]
MPERKTTTSTVQKTSVTHRVSIGIIAVSLSLISLALGTALFFSPAAGYLFMPPTVTEQSVPSTATAVTLTWTAPGDDGNVGQAASYDLRYSTNPITVENFPQAQGVPNLPGPQPAGSTESVSVGSLQPSTTYFFALKATDDAGNVSVMSNVATKTTSALAEACVPTYTCSEWTACSNGSQNRTCSVTNNCQSGLGQPITTQACTSPAATPAAGGSLSHVVRHIVVASIGVGGGPAVRVIEPTTGKATAQFNVLQSKDRMGVNISAGDVDGDHQPDVVIGSGAGNDAVVKVFTPAGKQLFSFNPYPTDRRTGVDVATGDVDGDGTDEIITVPAKAAAQVKVFRFDSAKKAFTLLAQAFAYDRNSRQGFTVAAGDMDVDGKVEIAVTARANARSVTLLRVKGTQLQTIRRINPFPILFRTGLTIAIGDTYGTGRGQLIVTGGPTYYSDVKIFDINGRYQTHFLPTTKAWRGGVDVATLDVDQDGRDEVLTTSYLNGEPGVRVFRYDPIRRAYTLKQSYYAFARAFKNGFRLGAI